MNNNLAMSSEQEITIGMVSDCQSLNVRRHPRFDSEVICSIPASTEVMIEENESTDEFFKVYTVSGIEGYCMKRYIAIRE